MYFTRLPDHREPGFDEQAHFGLFQKHNIIFNAIARKSYCQEHVGCLSFKTVLSGEEWYGINGQQKAVRPGQFLILNDDQAYSSWIDAGNPVQSLSVFFKKEFSASVFHDVLHDERHLLDDPFQPENRAPEFFQTLYTIDATLQKQLVRFIVDLNAMGYQAGRVDEELMFLLRSLIKAHQCETNRAGCVGAIKLSTKKEIYKRLCVAKDVLHSTFMHQPDLKQISAAACLSVPQLVRQFKAAFQVTPHQYLIAIRLSHAASLLKQTSLSVNEITAEIGFENTSAFCRAFKMEYGTSPLSFRALNCN